MSTPVLSKQQQSQSLASTKKSGKKVPAKGLRNVLAQPYERFWPVVSAEDASSLEKLLNKLLPGLKRNSHAIPWALLRKMDKEERLAAQKKARTDAQNENNIKELNYVTIGVNAVTRDLEKANLCSVLLDSTVESLLIKHVVLMAQNKNIPVLLVPFLKKATLEHIGFASAAIGLKTPVADAANSLYEVHQGIAKLSEAIPSAKKVLLLAEEPEVSRTIEDDAMSVEDENMQQAAPFTLSTNMYKYRSTRKERSFVPPSLTDKCVDDKNEWSDFIAIGKDEPEMETGRSLFSHKNRRYVDVHTKVAKKPTKKPRESEEFISFGGKDNEESPRKAKKQKTNKGTYVSLKVKRIQGNSNRVKATKAPKQKKKGGK